MIRFFVDKWCQSRRVFLLGAVLTVTACSPPQGDGRGKVRFLWPPSVEDARIEYIGSFRSTAEVEGKQASRLADVVFGKLPPNFLFEKPQAVAASASGKVFVADPAVHKIHVLDLQRHTHGFLQDANGNDAQFNLPMGLSVDSQRLFVVDTAVPRAYVFSLAGELINAFDLEALERPTQITVDEKHGRIYIVDTAGHRIAVYDEAFVLQSFIGARGREPGLFNYPLDVDIDDQGNLYVLDSMNARVQVFTPEGVFVRAFGERGMADGSFRIAKSLAVSPSGHVYVTDSLAHRFVVFDTQGNYLLTLGGRSKRDDGRVIPGGFYMPHGIDIDENEGIWVVDSLNRTLHQFQYLNKAYLAEHPIKFEDVYRPER